MYDTLLERSAEIVENWKIPPIGYKLTNPHKIYTPKGINPNKTPIFVPEMV